MFEFMTHVDHKRIGSRVLVSYGYSIFLEIKLEITFHHGNVSIYRYDTDFVLDDAHPLRMFNRIPKNK